jgi:S-adenosylmethionine:tRNA ribosyltransferase-isomerase
MLVADFDFDLPPDLIAQAPRPRGTSRLMVVDRRAGTWREGAIADLPAELNRGDLLVVNDTRVFPARLIGRRDPSGGAAECFLLEPARAGDDDVHDGAGDVADNEHAATWDALVHPGQKLKTGARMVFEDNTRAPGVTIAGEILAQRFFGRRTVRLVASGAPTLSDAIDAIGHVPLPPYITRPDTADDRERYQTIFAHSRGSVAAPTAGLHFDAALMSSMADAGIATTAVTLHVGYGTFKPVRVDRVDAHTVDAERYAISEATAAAIAHAHASRHRVVAVGTTTTRALESAATSEGGVRAGAGLTSLFIRPGDEAGAGHRFQAVDALVTNFHLPRSSLLMLVAAFAGRDLVLAAYRDAIARGFRFYSYGDAMLIK